MKRLLSLFAILAFLLAVPMSHVAWGKGHVPSHKEQVCHKGTVITVGASAVEGHKKHGDCRIDKATHLPPLFTGDSCDDSDCE